MTSFRADLDQMLDLSARMSTVRSSLEDEGHGGVDCSALGDPDAVSALQGFVSGWSYGRSEIISGLDTVQGALKGASDTYRGSDRGMAGRLRPVG